MSDIAMSSRRVDRIMNTEAIVCEQHDLGSGLHWLVLDSFELASALKPGQFLELVVQGEARQLARIPLSFSSVWKEAPLIDLFYEVTGAGTRQLAQLDIGDTVGFIGPLGNGWRLSENLDRVLLVSGGTGRVPVMAASGWLDDHDIAYDEVWGVRTAGLIWGLAQDETTKGKRIITTDDGSAGEKGLALDPALRLLAERSYDLVLVCGPNPLMQGVSKAAIEKGVACQVSLEPMMACGFGACNTCAVKTVSGMRSACVDGPVFDAREVVW